MRGLVITGEYFRTFCCGGAEVFAGKAARRGNVNFY
jgi:hypothetical protein